MLKVAQVAKFSAKMTFWAKFGNFFKSSLKHLKWVLKHPILAGQFFSSWYFPYLVIIVAEKALSSSHLRTLRMFRFQTLTEPEHQQELEAS